VKLLLEIMSQPIVNVITGQEVMAEYLSRPSCSLKDYFSTKDRNVLIRRELHAILQSIEESKGMPYNVNVTLYTLPFVSKLPFMNWSGGIEIVEWETSISPYFKQTRISIRDLQVRGLFVWADDITADTIDMWLRTGVNGFKVEIDEITKDFKFLNELKETKKPIIVERIETKEQHEWIKSKGIPLAQGFYYGMPQKIGKKVSLQTG
jgi:hypothetical protein